MNDIILVTGFEPFGGEAHNSSWLLAQALGSTPIAGLELRVAMLPTRFGSSAAALEASLKAVPAQRLRAVVALGQATSRSALSFERVAINWVDARIPDNDGAQPIDEPARRGAPAALFSTLPIKPMAAAARDAGVAAELSYSAGSFVCNQLFYLMQHRLRRRRSVMSGFVHVPALPGPMSLEAMLHGMRAALEVLTPAAPAMPTLHSEGRID